VPIIKASDLTEDEQRQFIIKDNVSGGEWDWEQLASEWDAEKLDEWGLDMPEFGAVEELEAEEDDVNEAPPEEPITVLGDLYEIGEHRLLCGDSTDSDQVAKLMNGQKADMVFTDPPYGVAINNTNGKILGDEDLQVFDECLPNIELFSKEDSHIYIYFGVQFISECVSKIKEYFKQTNILIQRITHENKPSPEGYFKNNYEVCYFSNKGKKKFNSGILEVSESTKNDSRYKGDGFLDTYLALNEIKSTEHNAKSIHPTQKTIEICSFYQKVSSNQNDLVFDLFLGSGSTMVASHQLKRKCYGMELDPKYCDVIVKRMIKLDPTLTVKRNGIDCKKDFE
jgi:DNA modification methylase